MKRPTKRDLWLLVIQIAVWAAVISLPPVTTFLSTRNWTSALMTTVMVWNMLRSPILLYFVNYYLMWPWLFVKRRFVWFAVVNLLLMVGANYWMFFIGSHTKANGFVIPKEAWVGMIAGFFVYFLFNCASIATAIGIRQFIRMRAVRRQLEEEKQKHTEAELAWLKNQINPHFLFNTLNNISSLTQIDPDQAQDSIAQLSDLLRYAMYETNKPQVSIQGEVEFMRNYIELMKLRCNERAVVNVQFAIQNSDLSIAPLLFISLIENAFKHGLSSSRDSKIDITLEQTDNQIVFTCDNTNYPKDDADRSGSGIGLENTRRRLDLLYPGHYQWEQSLSEDNIYHVRIILQL